MRRSVCCISTMVILLVACSKDPDPPLPDPINSYFTLYNFLMVPYEISWTSADESVEIAHPYGIPIQAFTTMDRDSAEVSFTVKRSGTGTVIESEVFMMKKNKFYIIAIIGTENDPILLFEPMNIKRPDTEKIKIRFLQAAEDLDPVDVYIGGTGQDSRVLSGLAFADITAYIELSQVLAWDSLIISPQGIFPSDSTLFSYTRNEVILPDNIYLGVIAHSDNSPLSSLKLELFEHPVDN